MSKEQIKQKLPNHGTFKIIGIVEPWAPLLHSQLMIVTINHRTGKDIIEETRPDRVGIFLLKLAINEELKNLLNSGDIEIKAIDDKHQTLASRIIGPYEGIGPLAVKLHTIMPSGNLNQST